MNSIYKWCDDFLSKLTYLRVLYGAIILYATILFITTKCSTAIVESTKQSSPPVTLSVIEEEMYHNAIYEATATDQTCYDAQTKLWFVHSVKPYSLNSWPKGWYYEAHDNFEIIKLGNGTIAITNVADVLNTNIDPTVTGLSCRTHELKPSDKAAIEKDQKQQSKQSECEQQDTN